MSTKIAGYTYVTLISVIYPPPSFEVFDFHGILKSANWTKKVPVNNWPASLHLAKKNLPDRITGFFFHYHFEE